MSTSIHIYFDYTSAPVNSPRWADFDLEDDDDASTDNGLDQMECLAYSEITDSLLTSSIEDDLNVPLSSDVASVYGSDSDTVGESLSSGFVELNGIGCPYTCLEYNCGASFLTEENLEWHYVEDHMPNFPHTTPHADSELELPLILGDSTISVDGLTWLDISPYFSAQDAQSSGDYSSASIGSMSPSSEASLDVLPPNEVRTSSTAH